MATAQEALSQDGTVDKRWFALYTKPHKEYLVQEVLRSRGVETYLPEIAVVERRKDRRSMKPFLPHYLFGRFNPQGERISNARWTPGLRRIVSAGQRPVPVPDEVVAYLQRRLEDAEDVDVPDSPFKKGDVVRVARGPLEGLEAIFDEQVSPEGRVWVFLKVMNRLVRTKLDMEDLIPPY